MTANFTFLCTLFFKFTFPGSLTIINGRLSLELGPLNDLALSV